MIHIAICDDMPQEIQALKSLLTIYSKERGISLKISEFQNGYLFLDALQKEPFFQLCFLDILMPALSGIETAKELRLLDKDIPLIFTTSSTEYALMGYGVQATNYLVKPLKEEALFLALDDALRKVKIQSEKQLCFPTSSGLQRISPESISYIEASNHHATVHLRPHGTLLCRMSFSQITTMLETEIPFKLISRSILLNFDTVIGMIADEFVLETGDHVPIPRRKKKLLTQAFLEYTMEQENRT